MKCSSIVNIFAFSHVDCPFPICSYYQKQWLEAQDSLNDLLQQEIPPEPPKPEKDRLTAFQNIATLYLKYLQIFRKIEGCYDQVVHPQKRRVLRRMLDGVMGRLIELKNEMVLLEFSEFHYFDDILSDLKLTPVSSLVFEWCLIIICNFLPILVL